MPAVLVDVIPPCARSRPRIRWPPTESRNFYFPLPRFPEIMVSAVISGYHPGAAVGAVDYCGVLAAFG